MAKNTMKFLPNVPEATRGEIEKQLSFMGNEQCRQILARLVSDLRMIPVYETIVQHGLEEKCTQFIIRASKLSLDFEYLENPAGNQKDETSYRWPRPLTPKQYHDLLESIESALASLLHVIEEFHLHGIPLPNLLENTAILLRDASADPELIEEVLSDPLVKSVIPSPEPGLSHKKVLKIQYN
jgi:hypothetical protein